MIADQGDAAGRCGEEGPQILAAGRPAYCTWPAGHGPLITDNGSRWDHGVRDTGTWWENARPEVVADDIERHYFGVCPLSGIEIKVAFNWDPADAAAARRAPVALTPENGLAPTCPHCKVRHLLVEVTPEAAAWLSMDAAARDYDRPGMPGAGT